MDSDRPVRVCLTRCPLSAADEDVHSLPCHIHHDGPAAVKNYFRPQQKTQDNGPTTWHAAFRGVELEGTPVELAKLGYQGEA